MNSKLKKESDFVGYEYTKITVKSAQASLYLDSYENFGWEFDAKADSSTMGDKTTLHLRRDRKILNKMELTRLQRNFEASMKEISALETSKTTTPQIVAMTIGILGTAFMAGSVFAVTANPPMILLCIILAVPGFIGWIFPYFVFRRLVSKRLTIVTPLIEEKYDEIYELCKKGQELLI